jgi:hypothetical protein
MVSQGSSSKVGKKLRKELGFDKYAASACTVILKTKGVTKIILNAHSS